MSIPPTFPIVKNAHQDEEEKEELLCCAVLHNYKYRCFPMGMDYEKRALGGRNIKISETGEIQ